MLHLGKTPATPDNRDLRLTDFWEPAAVTIKTAPARFGHGNLYKADGWEMLGNGPDESVAPGFQGAGDCVWAMAAHISMEVNRLAGRRVSFTGRNVIADYSDATGYRIGVRSTDNGTNMRAALKYRRSTGIVDAAGVRHKIGAFLALRAGDFDQMIQACYTFSAVELGIEFPASAMEQFDAGEVWDVVPGSPIEGGHAIPGMGRSSRDVAGVVSWARRQGMTRAFWEKYGDEGYVVVYPDELNASGVNERGLNIDALNAALSAL